MYTILVCLCTPFFPPHSDHITIAVPAVNPAVLYHHILAHSDVFGMQTKALSSVSSSGSSASEDVCLVLNVSPEHLGPTTSPELSNLLRDGHESYKIQVIALCDLSDSTHALKLDFYLLLVHKFDKFPRLTCSTPPQDTPRMRIPLKISHSPEEATVIESELHLSVRKHRMKLGLDPLLKPTSASQLVLDDQLIGQHMARLRVHFEGVVKEAIHHMRRDELWKRMLYGRYRTQTESKMNVVRVLTVLCCDVY